MTEPSKGAVIAAAWMRGHAVQQAAAFASPDVAEAIDNLAVAPAVAERDREIAELRAEVERLRAKLEAAQKFIKEFFAWVTWQAHKEMSLQDWGRRASDFLAESEATEK